MEDLGWTFQFATSHGHFNAKVLRFSRLRIRIEPMRLAVVIPKWVDNQFVVCRCDFKIQGLADLFETEMIDIRDPDSLQILERKVKDQEVEQALLPPYDL